MDEDEDLCQEGGCAPCDGGVVIFFVSYSKKKKKEREKG